MPLRLLGLYISQLVQGFMTNTNLYHSNSYVDHRSDQIIQTDMALIYIPSKHTKPFQWGR